MSLPRAGAAGHPDVQAISSAFGRRAARTSPAPPLEGGRAAYLAEVSCQLWPDPARVTMHGGGGRAIAHGRQSGAAESNGARPPSDPFQTVSEFIVLPGLRRPRLLVPFHRRAAAIAVQRYGKPSSMKARLATQGLSLVLRTGLGTAILRERVRVQAPAGASTIESYLSEELGQRVIVSLYLGSARANRKPVLQLLTPHGDTFGYAKVGVNPLTKELVGVERDALTRLGNVEMASLTVPRVMHYGTWQGFTVLVLSPLPVWLQRSTLPTGHLARAMREVAALDGISRQPLAGSRYWQGLGERLSTAEDTEDRAVLSAVLEDLAARAGDAVLSFGAWHGDWAPWNMARTSNGLLVWDWERFDTNVPLGFDALHHWLQGRLQSKRQSPLTAAGECAEQAVAILAPLEVDAAAAEITAAVYLADIATRYLVDRQAEAGSRFGRPGDWLVPALARQVARL